MFRIWIHWFRIRIHHFRLNTIRVRIRVWWLKIGKNYSWKKPIRAYKNKYVAIFGSKKSKNVFNRKEFLRFSSPRNLDLDSIRIQFIKKPQGFTKKPGSGSGFNESSHLKCLFVISAWATCHIFSFLFVIPSRTNLSSYSIEFIRELAPTYFIYFTPRHYPKF